MESGGKQDRWESALLVLKYYKTMTVSAAGYQSITAVHKHQNIMRIFTMDCLKVNIFIIILVIISIYRHECNDFRCRCIIANNSSILTCNKIRYPPKALSEAILCSII